MLCAPHRGVPGRDVAELPCPGTWGTSPGFSCTVGDHVFFGTGLAAVAGLAGTLVPSGAACPSPLVTQERRSLPSTKPAAHSQAKPPESSRQSGSSAHLPARRYLPGQGQSTAPGGIPSQRAPTPSARQVALMESCPGQRPGLQVPPAGSSRGLSHTQLTGHLGENCFITAAGAQHTLEEEAGKRRPQIEKDL